MPTHSGGASERVAVYLLRLKDLQCQVPAAAARNDTKHIAYGHGIGDSNAWCTGGDAWETRRVVNLSSHAWA